MFDRFGVPAVPHKANFIEPSFAFTVHFLFLSTSALNGHPMAKMNPAFDVESGHVAMTFAGFERFESLKCLFPPPITLTPYEPKLIELCATQAVLSPIAWAVFIDPDQIGI